MDDVVQLIALAQECLRGALQARNPESLERLVEMADEYMRRAEALSHAAPGGAAAVNAARPRV